MPTVVGDSGDSDPQALSTCPSDVDAAIFAGGAGHRHQSAEGGHGVGRHIVAAIAPLGEDLRGVDRLGPCGTEANTFPHVRRIRHPTRPKRAGTHPRRRQAVVELATPGAGGLGSAGGGGCRSGRERRATRAAIPTSTPAAGAAAWWCAIES